jgi:hypothetical protein
LVEAITIYRAADGKEFPTHQEALAYEASRLEFRLAGLTVEQVLGALARAAAHLDTADALEEAGARIGRLRRGTGELKRAPKKDKTAAPTTATDADAATFASTLEGADETAEAPAPSPAATAEAPIDWQDRLRNLRVSLDSLSTEGAILDVWDRAQEQFAEAPAMIGYQAEQIYEENQRRVIAIGHVAEPDMPF